MTSESLHVYSCFFLETPIRSILPFRSLMSYEIIDKIEKQMSESLTDAQMGCLHGTLVECIADSILDKDSGPSDKDAIGLFITAKRIEGCSEKTLKLYSAVLEKAFSAIGKPVKSITTDDLRTYLSDYQRDRNVSKVTIDNVRRILSSFFTWLEDEDMIFRSPVRRIRKVKSPKVVKETYTDEALEMLRDGCTNIRDLAMVDLLASTGMRVGELVGLDICDVDFENRECVVFGKGDKERIVYFDARTKVHLSNYIKSRSDDNSALFVSLLSPYERLNISGVESRLKKLGIDLGLGRVHPHKFRRTLATRAIDRGMPIEQVQTLLGHTKIDTTLEYAIVNQNNVKASHKRYIS